MVYPVLCLTPWPKPKLFFHTHPHGCPKPPPPVTVPAPLTSKTEKKKRQPTHYYIRKAKGLDRPSTVLAEQLGTFDKKCIIRYLGRVSKGQMRGIDDAVKVQLGYYIQEHARRDAIYRGGKEHG